MNPREQQRKRLNRDEQLRTITAAYIELAENVKKLAARVDRLDASVTVTPVREAAPIG